MIEQAKNYILSQVDDPALQHPDLDKSIKYKIQNSKNVVNHMKKTGDLYAYLSRFNRVPSPGESIVYDEMKKLGLLTYEDVLPTFIERFSNDFDNVTTLNDFVIGGTYSSWDIAIFAKTYNVQSGIYVIKGQPHPKAIFIKATLSNGKYPNEWLIENEELKYYFYSLKEKFSPTYEVNQAILNSKQTGTPIYVFIKEGTVLTLSGIYEYVSDHTEVDGSMWFRLRKVTSTETARPVTDQEYYQELEKKVRASQHSSKAERQKRLQEAAKKPETIQVVTTTFKRNSDVVAEVLERASGYCEACDKEAPFIRATDGTPYLEVHHIIPLAENGEDTVENAIALCPNCHREAHFGMEKMNLRKKMMEKLSRKGIEV
jgi:5-methylcytosine-specific restriction protein A